MSASTFETDLPGQRSTLKSVALPSEHGGWSLTLEPAVLGLLVAPSWQGLALLFAAMLAFLCRTPLKIAVGDIRRHRWLDRSKVAIRAASIEIALVIALVIYASIRSQGNFWIPLLVASPLVVIQFWFDIRSKSRRLVPELAGTIGIASVSTAIAISAGSDTKIAYGLWVVVAARGVAAISYARVQVLRKKGRDHRLSHSDWAQGFAALVIIVGLLLEVVPLASVLAIVAIALFNIISVRAKALPAKVIGVQQMIFGFVVIAITAVAI